MTIELGHLEWDYAEREYLESIAQRGLASQFCAVIQADDSAYGAQMSVQGLNSESGNASQFYGWSGDDMTDFAGAKPVKTERDNDLKIILVDGASGTSATKILSIVGEGDAFVAATNDFGIPAIGKNAAGNAQILPIGTTGLVVEATNLDIRDLTAASDSVAIKNGSNQLAIDASGFIGVTDGGGSLTVDASNLDIRDLSDSQDKVAIGDGTDTLAINADGSINVGNTVAVSATDLDIRNLAYATDSVTAHQGTSPWVISDLTHTKDSVKIGDGTDFVAVNSDGSINVVVGAGGSEVSDYKTSAAVAKDAVVNHDYTITNAKTFGGLKVLVGGSTQLRVQVGTWDGTTFTVFATYFQNARENFDHNISALSYLGDGSTKKIRIAIKNLDAASDVYSTLQGIES